MSLTLRLFGALLLVLTCTAAPHALIINQIDGIDDKWSPLQARNLTYCVSMSSFGSHYADIVYAMDVAASAWESAANVKFIHDVASDVSCTDAAPVVFNVKMWIFPGLMRSFYPSTTRSARELWINPAVFGNIKPLTLTGLIRRSMGHMLGFRNESTRPEAPDHCFEDDNWRALTPYDRASIMHQGPPCGGSNVRNKLQLTNDDEAGALQIYPFFRPQ